MTRKAVFYFLITVTGIVLALFSAGYDQFFLMHLGIIMALGGLANLILTKDLLKD